jgi:hypothetical protein
MSEFLVKINGGRVDVSYRIWEDSHNDTTVLAAQEALATYRRHGHTSFPYNDRPLTISVSEIEAGSS